MFRFHLKCILNSIELFLNEIILIIICLCLITKRKSIQSEICKMIQNMCCAIVAREVRNNEPSKITQEYKVVIYRHYKHNLSLFATFTYRFFLFSRLSFAAKTDVFHKCKYVKNRYIEFLV